MDRGTDGQSFPHDLDRLLRLKTSSWLFSWTFFRHAKKECVKDLDDAPLSPVPRDSYS